MERQRAMRECKERGASLEKEEKGRGASWLFFSLSRFSLSVFSSFLFGHVGALKRENALWACSLLLIWLIRRPIVQPSRMPPQGVGEEGEETSLNKKSHPPKSL